MTISIIWYMMEVCCKETEPEFLGKGRNVLRRPLVFAAAAFGGGIGIGYGAKLCTEGWCLCLLTAAALLVLVNLQKPFNQKAVNRSEQDSSKGKKEILKKSLVFFCLFFTGSLLIQSHMDEPPPVVYRQGTYAELSGLVTGLVRKDEGFSITAHTPEGRILVSYYGELSAWKEMIGRTASFSGTVKLPAARRNPKCFDYQRHLQSCGIYVQMTADAVEPDSKSRGAGRAALLWYASRLRMGFEEKLDQYVDSETKSMVMAMMFGDKSGLDEEVYEDFQKNGTAHVLAVSGLHVGVVYGFFLFFWRWKKGILFYGCTSALLLLYAALADFSPSVIRAAVMIGIHLGAGILHRRYDFLSAAAFTFILMLWSNPMQLFHTGFQLSFLAAASLGVILPFVEKLYQGAFLSTVSIQAGMLPYTAYVFNYVSLGAFFANIPIVFLAGILMPAGMCALIFSCFCDRLFLIGAAFLQQGCRLLIWINDLFYADGRTSFDVVSPPLFFLVLYYGTMFFFLSEKGRILFLRRRWKELAAGVFLAVGISCLISAGAEDGFSKTGIVFVDVGQGDCIHVKTPEGKNYLIDGGGSVNYDTGKKVLKPYLLKNGVKKLDCAFVTHLHEDHYGGIRSLARQGMADKIGVYEGSSAFEYKLKEETGADLLYLKKGQRLVLGKDVYLDILAPEGKTMEEYRQMAEHQEDENASSLIMKLRYQGIDLLITGDIDQQGEAELTEVYGKQGLKSHILKVAHHGSKYSSKDSFIDAVKPLAAVVQVGKNNFGHPAQTVIEKYRQRFIMVYRNDTSGAIGIFIRKGGRGISVQRMMKNKE